MYYCHFIIILFVAARDRLSDLTSREGDWFMDELCTMGGNVFQMSTTLEMCLSVSYNTYNTCTTCCIICVILL